ncbi:PorT family protein [Candidatus Falkowbacteria bacterium]|nr:PorT family protein [Candidatus Falkowbacteria bacterium]
MKRVFLTVSIIISVGFLSSLHAQRIMGALIGGFNTTNVQGDDVFGFRKFGINAGAAAIVPFGEKWSFTLEAVYSQKGAFHREGGRGMDYRYEHDYNQYKLQLNYLEVPVLVHFHDKKWLKAGAGFSYGRLVGVEEYEDHVRIATTTLNDGPYDTDEYSALLDVQFPIYKQLKIDARYSFSLFKIRTRTYENVRGDEEKIRKQYNQVLSFRLIWVFNESTSRESRLKEGL